MVIVISSEVLHFIFCKNSLPSPAQCRRLLKIIEKAEDKGYVMS
jgi:hypothetical protein